MKILLLGLSPYLFTSRSQVLALIARYLYIHSHEVAIAAWGHDVNYFTPDENNRFYYTFDIPENGSHSIPLFPFFRGEKEVISIYEILQNIQPDLIITVGDYGDFLYMKAIKAYCSSVKWLFVFMNYSSPIDEQNVDLFENADHILCTSDFAYESISSFYKGETSVQYIGRNSNYSNQNLSYNKFRIMAIGKPLQTDNLPMLMEAVSDIQKEREDVELYLHTSIYDKGDYNLEKIRNSFDPEHKFIFFPEKYVSLYDGLPSEELSYQMNLASLFVSIPFVSATSMNSFDAIACGCVPLLSDCGSNRNLIHLLSIYKGDYEIENLLVSCTKILTTGGSHLHICQFEELKKKIIFIYNKWKNNKGNRLELEEFILKYDRVNFLEKLSADILKMGNSEHVVCLEEI